jgi:ribosome-associated protein
LNPADIKTLIEKSLDADKAIDINTIDLNDQSPIADYMIVASGTSTRHVAALAQKLRDLLESRGLQNVRLEGIAQSDWVVVDAGDVIVHLFRPEVRSFYNIEKMWGPYAGFDVVVGAQPVTA